MDSKRMPVSESPAVRALRATLAEAKANLGEELLLRTVVAEGIVEALEVAIVRQIAAEHRATALRKALDEIRAAGVADPGLLERLIDEALNDDNASSGKAAA